MKKRLFLIVIATLAFSGAVPLGIAPRLDKARVKAYAEAKMASYGVPGLQICVRDHRGMEILSLSLGYADLETRRTINRSTRLKIGSNTKSFTAMAILILAERGQIGLNEHIDRYLDISPPHYGKVTIRQLMNMNSGLRGYINDDDDDRIIDRILTHPAKQIPPHDLIQRALTLTNQLGTTDDGKFHYTNTNYILLGMLIEKVSKVSYADFIYRELLKPLGLHETYMPVDSHYGYNVGKGYHIDKAANTSKDYSALDLSYVWSAGAMISTASDLSRWIGMIGTDAVIRGKGSIDVYRGLPISRTIQYTSGLIQEPEYFWHNGTVLGYHGEMRYLKGSGTSIAVLANCTLAGFPMDPIREIIDEIARQLTVEMS